MRGRADAVNLFQVDLQALRHRNRRVEQLKSYRGTEDELPGDEERLSKARKDANHFAVEMLFFYLGGGESKADE